MTKKKTRFIAALVLQLCIIGAIIIAKLFIYATGVDVLLRIEPVDPRDPLRGDYVTFRYADLSTVDAYMFNYEPVEVGDTVYVPLRRSGRYYTNQWGIVNDSTNIPVGTLFITGVVSDRFGDATRVREPIIPESPEIKFPVMPLATSYELTFGLEEYFIPEGTGRGVTFFDKEAAARVVIDEKGNASLKQVLVDGYPWP